MYDAQQNCRWAQPTNPTTTSGSPATDRDSTSCGVGQFERLANVLCFLTVLRRRQTVCVWCPFQPLLEAVRERRWWADWQPSWRQPRHRGAHHTYSRALAGRVGISIATRQHTLKAMCYIRTKAHGALPICVVWHVP